MREGTPKGKKSSSDWNEEGLNHFEKKAYNDALQCFINASELNPRDPSYFKNIAETYYRLGNLSKAIGHYNIAIRLDSQRADYYNDLGVIYEADNKYREALKVYKKAVELNPMKKEYLENEAKMLRKITEYYQALRIYHRLSTLYPKDATIINNIGICYFNLREYPLAHQFFKLAHRLTPDHITYLQNLADTLRHLGKYSEAIVLYRRVLRKNPTDDLSWNFLGDAYLKRRDSGDVQLAKHALKKATELNAQNSLYWLNLGNAYRFCRNYATAIKSYKKALADPVNQSNHILYNNLSLCYFFKNDMEKAKEWVQQAIGLHSNDTVLLENYVAILSNLHEYSTAIDVFKQLMMLKPFDDYLNNAYGLCLLHLGQYDIAEGRFSLAIDTNPKYSPYLRNLFTVYEKTENILQLQEVVKKLEALIAVDASLYSRAANVHAKLKDYPLAIEMISKALSFDSINAQYYALRASYYKELGDMEKSEADNRKSLELSAEVTDPSKNDKIV